MHRQSSPSLLTMLKSCEAFFIYAHLIPFIKQFSSSAELVTLLRLRGLYIEDQRKTEDYLDNIGYYRLSAYMYPLLKTPKTAHFFKEGATFKKVMMLYRFDKKLRLLMFNEIEKIEIAVRRAVMQIPAEMTNDPFWLTTPAYFLDNAKFSETMRVIRGEYAKSKEEFIPVIAVTRNACGHHARVWNKRNAMQPAIPSNPTGCWITLPTDSMRTYFDLCIIKYFLNIISPKNDMLDKMQTLFAEYPEVDLGALGFPSGI